MLRLIRDRQEALARKALFDRDLVVDHAFLRQTGKVAAIVGPRRAGKSMFLLQIARQLDLAPTSAVWIDFSELPWSEFGTSDWETLWLAALELTPSPVFFLDEIQLLKDFEAGLRYLQNLGAPLYITGSNSTFLQKHLATSLRGKVLVYPLWTLSFSEFLRFKHLPPHPRTSAEQATWNLSLEEFLTWGGFPEVVLADREDLKAHLLDSYIDTMLLRDVLERHQVKNFLVLEKLFQKALLSFTKEFSVHRWYNDFRSQGYKVSKDTLYEYLAYFEESLFLHVVENAANPAAGKKIFLTDNGLYQRVKDRPDAGKLWENACYLHLARHAQVPPQFWRDDQGELDFLTDRYLVQVREQEPLKALALRFPHHKAQLWIHDANPECLLLSPASPLA